MTETGAPELLELDMSVVGYEVSYGRSKPSPSKPPESLVRLTMSVRGARVEDEGNKPISRVFLEFSEGGPFLPGRVGNLFVEEDSSDIVIFARLPLADFAGFWAALRLDRVARLRCLNHRGTVDVVSLTFRSEGSLFPLFPS